MGPGRRTGSTRGARRRRRRRLPVRRRRRRQALDRLVQGARSCPAGSTAWARCPAPWPRRSTAAAARVRVGGRLLRRHRRRDGHEDTPPGDSFLSDVCVRWEARRRHRPSTPASPSAICAPAWCWRATAACWPGSCRSSRPASAASSDRAPVHARGSRSTDEIAAIRFVMEHESAGAGEPDRPGPGAQRRVHQGPRARCCTGPTILPVPGFAARAALGEFAGDVLTGQNAVPARLLEAGFEFTHTDVRTRAARRARPDARRPREPGVQRPRCACPRRCRDVHEHDAQPGRRDGRGDAARQPPWQSRRAGASAAAAVTTVEAPDRAARTSVNAVVRAGSARSRPARCGAAGRCRPRAADRGRVDRAQQGDVTASRRRGRARRPAARSRAVHTSATGAAPARELPVDVAVGAGRRCPDRGMRGVRRPPAGARSAVRRTPCRSARTPPRRPAGRRRRRPADEPASRPAAGNGDGGPRRRPNRGRRRGRARPRDLARGGDAGPTAGTAPRAGERGPARVRRVDRHRRAATRRGRHRPDRRRTPSPPTVATAGGSTRPGPAPNLPAPRRPAPHRPGPTGGAGAPGARPAPPRAVRRVAATSRPGRRYGHAGRRLGTGPPGRELDRDRRRRCGAGPARGRRRVPRWSGSGCSARRTTAAIASVTPAPASRAPTVAEVAARAPARAPRRRSRPATAARPSGRAAPPRRA